MIQTFKHSHYIGKIEIGSPKKEFSVLFDTGSSWLWVGDPESKFKNTFDCVQSQTCLAQIEKPLQLNYAKGTGIGYLVTDEISMGSRVLIENMTFVVMNEVLGMGPLSADGVLGLGLKSSSNDYSTILDTLKDQKIISSKSFSLYLSKTMKSGEFQGELIIGGIDLGYKDLASQFEFVNVVEGRFWATKVTDILFMNDALPISSNTKAVLDSGSNVLTLPSHAFYHLKNKLAERGYHCGIFNGLIKCNNTENTESFPSLKFKLDGINFDLPAEYYTMKQGEHHVLLVQKLDYDDYMILGDPFMKHYYTYFDADNLRIGLVKANQEAIQEANQSKLIKIYLFCSIIGLTLMFLIWFKLIKKRKEVFKRKEFDEETHPLWLEIAQLLYEV